MYNYETFCLRKVEYCTVIRSFRKTTLYANPVSDEKRHGPRASQRLHSEKKVALTEEYESFGQHVNQPNYRIANLPNWHTSNLRPCSIHWRKFRIISQILLRHLCGVVHFPLWSGQEPSVDQVGPYACSIAFTYSI